MKRTTFFMVGMPASGKTTYLCQLGFQVLMDNNDSRLKLNIADIPNGIGYIEEEIKKLNSYEPVTRTFENITYNIDFPLENELGEKIILSIPDSSGEYFRELTDSRGIKKEILEKLLKADELLFFINLETMAKEERIRIDEKSTCQMINEEAGVAVLKKENEETDCINNKIKEKPTQSQVCDLLQGLLFLIHKCQTAHCGRCKRHLDFGVIASPIVPYRNSPQTLRGLTADCRSFV